ncbi:NAD-dependent epimerase/dehydratase family protein [Metabacillus indicus]|uniref:NAD-dependent epimerase/dehydratase family protein n=1 Tax=Metabacillus indicus TaxID=246786 RepID=UPI000493129C|nr:NAD(P)-dependent oxidoreductase [Metabacillus indicus]KEZ52254.1 hypothetical protein AZ46_0200175 [Metabacillus indicus LMG 22858]
MKKAFIAGTLQFVGFSLCSRLLEEGVCVDGISNDYEDELEQRVAEEKLMMIGRNALFQSVESVPKEKEHDLIFCCIQDPADKESRIHENLLKECASLSLTHKIPLVLISSMEVYGENQLVIDKNTVPVPTTINGAAHLKQEQTLKKLFNQSGLLKIIRFPGLYGPWQPNSGSIHKRIVASLTGGSPVQDEREERRDLLYIEDAVNALIELSKLETFTGDTVHLSSGKENQWREAAMLLNEKKESGIACKVSEDIKYTVRSSVSLKEGLSAQTEWIRQNLYIFQSL